MTQDELKKIYVEAIQGQLGLLANKDTDGVVLFKHPDMGSFYFSIDTDDPEYLMLVFPNFADAKSTGLSREKLLELTNSVNQKAKAVKLSVRDNDDWDVVASIECFVAAPDHAPSQELINAIIKRSFSALKAGVNRFMELSKESSI